MKKSRPSDRADDVIGAVQPLAGPGLGHRLDAASHHDSCTRPCGRSARRRRCGRPGQTSARWRPRSVREETRGRSGVQAIGPLGLDILEQQRAVSTPERPFRELEPLSQALERFAFDQAGKTSVSQDRDHDRDTLRSRCDLW